MSQNEFNSEFCNVKFIEEDNIVLLTWKKFCCYDDYRNPTLFALELLKKHRNSNFVVDATNGFEDEKNDLEWGFSVLLPAMSNTDCKVVIFIMNAVNEIEDEMDMWTKEFTRYFTVKKVESYNDAINFLDLERKESNHIVIVPILIKPDCVNKFIKIISENVQHSRKEKGVMSFEAIQNKEVPTEFLLVEVYMTPEDQLKHRETTHFQAFKSQVGDLLQEPYQAKIYRSL